jgi:L-asparagine transporter-like permease
MVRSSTKEVEMWLAIVVIFCVVAILVFAAYAFVRPFTHTQYHHPSGSLWRPLD